MNMTPCHLYPLEVTLTGISRTVKDGQMGYYGRSAAGEVPESWAGGAPEP